MELTCSRIQLLLLLWEGTRYAGGVGLVAGTTGKGEWHRSGVSEGGGVQESET